MEPILSLHVSLTQYMTSFTKSIHSIQAMPSEFKKEMSHPNFFKGRKLVIATKHGKEKVIAPILEQHLETICFTPDNFDTDLLGTFSGEVVRSEDPITTARKKCLMAMEQSNCDLGVASEGSFGSHPALMFVPCDDEILILIDRKHGIEIVVRELSVETNFSGFEIKDEKELESFIRRVHFPSHGILLRKSKTDYSEMVKEFRNEEHLFHTYHRFMAKYSMVYVETDMRAMNNPMRMEVIRRATLQLINKVNSVCPACGVPGFDITATNHGLPCMVCLTPTRSTLSFIYTCKHCDHQKEEHFPHGKKLEDPMYCDACNP